MFRYNKETKVNLFDAAVKPWIILHSRSIGHAMRRTRSLTSFVAMVCLVLVAPNFAATSQDDAVGYVVRQQGAVTALRDAVPRPLHLGEAVGQGDRIVTGRDAKVEIEFRDGSTLAVGPGTDVEVDDYAVEDRRRGRLTLLIGIIRTSLSALWSGGFEVRTEAAIASVRSTDWVTEAKAGRSSVFVVSGIVEVTGTAEGTGVTLSEKQGTDVEFGGAPSPPKQWGSARVEDVLSRTRVP